MTDTAPTDPATNPNPTPNPNVPEGGTPDPHKPPVGVPAPDYGEPGSTTRQQHDAAQQSGNG